MCICLQCQSTFEQLKIMHHFKLDKGFSVTRSSLSSGMLHEQNGRRTSIFFTFSVFESKQNKPTVSVRCLRDCAQKQYFLSFAEKLHSRLNAGPVEAFRWKYYLATAFICFLANRFNLPNAFYTEFQTAFTQ